MWKFRLTHVFMTCYLWKDKGQIPHMTYIVKTIHTRLTSPSPSVTLYLVKWNFPTCIIAAIKTKTMCLYWSFQDALYFYGVSESKLNEKFLVQILKQVLFCLHLLSNTIAPLDMLICILCARRSDFTPHTANRLAYLQKKCVLRKLTKKCTSFWWKINQA